MKFHLFVDFYVKHIEYICKLLQFYFHDYRHFLWFKRVCIFAEEQASADMEEAVKYLETFKTDLL